jgi:uncharacterized protein
LSTEFFIISALCVLLTGISKSGFAGGLGMLSVPLMSLFIPPQTAAAILLPILCVIDLANIWKYRHNWIGRYIVFLIPGALIGIGIGVLSFRHLDANVLKLVVGSFALWFTILFILTGKADKREKNINPLKALFYGSLSGLSGFIAHAGGPPIKAFLLHQNIDKSRLVGTNSVFFFLMNYVKLIPYFFLGQFTAESLEVSLYLLPMVPVGVFIGFRLHNLVRQDSFVKIAYGLLTFAGLKLIWDGAQAFL